MTSLVKKIGFLISAFILLVSCQKTDYLFFITDRDDFLFMTESTNVPIINQDSLQFYLEPMEIANKNNIYKKFQTIKNIDRFSIKIILKIDTVASKRDYEFTVRTYNEKHKQTGKFILAKLNDNKDILCTGNIDKHLFIRRNCTNGESELKEIDTSGKIREYSRW